MSDFKWDEAGHNRVRALWAEGKSIAEIGRILGVSKNAIAGKRKRLDLTPRGSPILNRGVLDPYLQDAAFVEAFSIDWKSDMDRLALAMKHKVSRERAYALARKLRLPLAFKEEAPVVTLPPLASLSAPVVRVAAPARPPAPALRPVGTRAEPCRYPIGEPGTASFRCCDAPTAARSSYCPEHHQVCWGPVKVHVAVPDRLLTLLERMAGVPQDSASLSDHVARRRGIPVIWTEARRALLAAQAPYPAGPRAGQLREMLNALPGPLIATDKAVTSQRTYMRSLGLIPAAAPAVRPEAETVPPARPALQPIAETMPPDAEAPAQPRRVVSEPLRLGAAEGQRGLGGTDRAARETRPAIPPALATRDGSISTAALEQLRADPGEAVAMAWDDILEWGRRWAPEVIRAGGRPMTVIAALNKHKAREGLPPMRLGRNLFGTHGALPSAGAEVGERVA